MLTCTCRVTDNGWLIDCSIRAKLINDTVQHVPQAFPGAEIKSGKGDECTFEFLISLSAVDWAHTGRR